MKKRLMATALLAGTIVFGGATTATAEGAVDVTSAAPGATIVYTASAEDTGLGGAVIGAASLDGVLADEQATLASTRITEVSSKADGSISVAITLPTSAPVGSVYAFDITVGAFQDSETITLAGAPAILSDTGSGSRSALPSGGVDATPYIWFGGGLLLLGAGIISVLAFARRSRDV